jgi:hypothetical protein
MTSYGESTRLTSEHFFFDSALTAQNHHYRHLLPKTTASHYQSLSAKKGRAAVLVWACLRLGLGVCVLLYDSQAFLPSEWWKNSEKVTVKPETRRCQVSE